MNKWLYRAVGLASGALLMSNGVAHAATVEATPTVDAQAMRGLLADLFTPTGGQNFFGLSIDRDIFAAGMMPDLAAALPKSSMLPTDAIMPQTGQREELLPGLGLLGGAAGNGGLLGGLTGGAGGSGLISSLTGGLTGGGDSGGLLSGLTGGLTGGDGPLGGLTKGLTGSDGPLGALTGGLAGTPLGGLTGLLGGGADRASDGDGQIIDIDPATLQDLLANANGKLGTDGPASTDIVDPALRGTALDTSNQRPIQLDTDLARQVNDATNPMVSAMLADAMARHVTGGVDPTGFGTDFVDDADFAESHEEDLPLVGQLPLVGALLGPGGPLSQFLVVGDLFDNLPIVSDLTRGGLDLAAVDRLPVVGKILNQGLIQGSDSPGLPVVGSLPFIGPALNNLTDPLSSVTGSLGSLGSLGQVAGGQRGQVAPLPALGQPGSLLPAPVAVPNRVGQVAPAVQAPARIGIQRPSADHVGKHRAPTDTVRPVVVDAEYQEESAGLPLVGDLLGGGGMGTLPVSSLLRQLPLVSELPILGQLTAPLTLLRSMPVVGMVAGLLPVENA